VDLHQHRRFQRLRSNKIGRTARYPPAVRAARRAGAGGREVRDLPLGGSNARGSAGLRNRQLLRNFSGQKIGDTLEMKGHLSVPPIVRARRRIRDLFDLTRALFAVP